MQRLGTYLPQDRLRALFTRSALPSHTQGSAIFADISGFTPLTERLTRKLGARKGVEALSLQLDAVYGALIDQVERYGGSIISFAGDSIIGWFEESLQPSAPLRAVTCAQGMQSAMLEFKELSLKVIVTSGSARRLVVGDPEIQRMDTLAGRTISRLAMGERVIQRGEVLLDEGTRQAIEQSASLRELRTDPLTTEVFAVLGSLSHPAERCPSPPLDPGLRTAEELRPWLLAPVFHRESAGMTSFLTELRPAVPLFLNFSGIDYDTDAEAEEKLDAFVSRTQRVVTKYGGSLLQLVIGDKGSYLYAVFGAFTAHEDDGERAVRAALELKQIPRELAYIHSLQMGISLGTLRVGAYGSNTRRTYAALGDDVNLAARLMTTASPGEILITGRVQIVIGNTFTLEPREPIVMKGKGEPQPVFAVTGISHHRATRLPEPVYRLPMVGRQAELELVNHKLDFALEGRGQVIGLIAEAGMGKSRLVAEIIRLARRRGFTGYGGACQSSGTNTPYLVWQPIWRAFFDLDLEMPQRRQMRLLEGELEDRVPDRVEALPLLGSVLDLPLPDNEFTGALEPKDRKSALEAMLEDCLKPAARETPLLIVLEDVHWIDPLSHDLLETLARVSENLPVCFVLAYRPPDLNRLQFQRVEKLPYFTRIELKDLTPTDAEQLIRAKLAQLFPERTGVLPKALVEELTSRSQGNPFFIEELLNFLHDRGLDPYDAHVLKDLELPASLQTLILSRIDQLTEAQRVTLKVASVIGRVFLFSWLYGYYPALGEEGIVKEHLAVLSRLDLTPLDTPDPELAYLFKHVVTQEVAYESLSFATRAQLHELLARYLEAAYPDDPPVDVLAFHYSRSYNIHKKREYLRKSGDIARTAYSNTAALEYYGQALETSPQPEEAIDLHLHSGAVLQLIGRREEAKDQYLRALQIATEHQIMPKIIEAEIRMGNAWMLYSGHAQALEWLERAYKHAVEIQDIRGICDALCEIGISHWRLGHFDASAQYLQQGLELARQLNDKSKQAYARTILGIIKADSGNFEESHEIFEEGLKLAREINDKRRIAGILNNYSNTHYREGNYEASRRLVEECLSVVHEIGDKRGEALARNNLGNFYYLDNAFDTAILYYQEALQLGHESDDKYILSVAQCCLGITFFRQGKLREADQHYQESLSLALEMGDQFNLALLHCYLGLLALAQDQPAAAHTSFIEGLTIAHQNNNVMYAIYNLIGLAALLNARGKAKEAVILLAASGGIARVIGIKIEPELQEPYDNVLADLANKVPGPEYRSAWETGTRMDIEQAVRFALENCPESNQTLM